MLSGWAKLDNTMLMQSQLQNSMTNSEELCDRLGFGLVTRPHVLIPILRQLEFHKQITFISTGGI